MTAAIGFTIVCALILILSGSLAVVNISKFGADMFNENSDPFEDFGKTFKRHGLLAIVSAISGIATMGGVIWIIVLAIQSYT